MNYKKKYLKYKSKYLNIKKILGGSDSGYNTPSPMGSEGSENNTPRSMSSEENKNNTPDVVRGSPGSDAPIEELTRYYAGLNIPKLDINESELSTKDFELNNDLISEIQDIVRERQNTNINTNKLQPEQNNRIKNLLLEGANPNVGDLDGKTALSYTLEYKDIEDINEIFEIWNNSSQKRRQLAKEYSDFDIITMPPRWTGNYYSYPISIRNIIVTIPQILNQKGLEASGDLVELITNKYLETFN